MSEPVSKEESTLIALAALAGFAVVQSEDDHGQRVYIVSRWAMARQLDSLAHLRAFLAQVGVQIPAEA